MAIRELQIRPNPQLLEILHAWSGGAIRAEQTTKHRLDVILDRPEMNNCLSGQMMLDLAENAKKFDDAENALIVIQGAAKSFCSGADLGLIKDISDRKLGVAMFEYMSSILKSIRRSPAIAVAKIHGHCLGGASELCSSADIRIAHRDAKIAFFQSKMGIVPSWGGAEYLEDIMGRGKALKSMTTARVMTARDARKLGWIDYVYEDEDEAQKFLSLLLSSGPEVTRAQKAMLNAVKVGVDAEKEVLESVWSGETHRMALEKQLNAVVKKKTK
ncbi:unnamed protein product [Caenorhabditis bovis]|uniref:Ethylmalonyl-CoA decarboxylase n=1 Tax=Caenorhabditis bovis TaxID=2654633 RepID=A0A8S1F6J2_9PELO|nr:unnamed protein product [Caenorhabditis bovis]